MLKGKKEVLITGGTGTLGQALVDFLLSKSIIKGIRVYSRDEFKQSEMKKRLNGAKNIAFLNGDVRDRVRLKRAMEGVDIVIHTAAMKQVPACEDDPMEAIKTNIIGAMNVVDCAIDCQVEKVMAISTDKAVNPVNLYGSTKLCMERIILGGNVYSKETLLRRGKFPQFSICRYGNVMGSRGSIIPILLKCKDDGADIPLTSPDMTRFVITKELAVRFILNSINEMKGGEIFVPRIPTVEITDLIEAICSDDGGEVYIIGVRRGEKIHETLISKEEIQHCKILFKHLTWNSPATITARRVTGNTKRGMKYFIIYPNEPQIPYAHLPPWIEEGYSSEGERDRLPIDQIKGLAEDIEDEYYNL